MGDSPNIDNSAELQGFLRNDPGLLSRLYRKVYPKVRVHVIRNSGSEDQAKDIYQEAFIACWRNVQEGKVHKESNMEAYLYTVARNKWTDHLRSAYTRNRVSTDAIAPLQTIPVQEAHEMDEQEERMERMRKAFSELGDACRRLLTLFYFDQKSMNEISETIGIAPASARNQKYRCMERLKNSTLETQSHG